jgi:MFS family permease
MMSIGFVYFVFAPSIATTLMAGWFVRRIGACRSLCLGLAFAFAGLPALLANNLAGVLVGMVMVGIGTFFAQAVATGFVSRAATADRGAASGLYLASYFLGGLAGSFVLGQVFDLLGWPATVIGIGASLGLAAALAFNIRIPDAGRASSP